MILPAFFIVKQRGGENGANTSIKTSSASKHRFTKDFGALCEGAGSAMFFAETEGELTLGSPAAFAADSVWLGNRAKQSDTPSVSPQKRRRSTFLREEGFKKKPLFIIDRVKAKPLFISFL